MIRAFETMTDIADLTTHVRTDSGQEPIPCALVDEEIRLAFDLNRGGKAFERMRRSEIESSKRILRQQVGRA